jgi:hypothetical protein
MLAQTAQQFGEFLENDCFTRVSGAGHVQTANEGDFYMIIGNEPAYLFRDGSWKFLCYQVSTKNGILFDEYNKAEIMKYFNCKIFQQLQLISVCSGRFFVDPVTKKVRR